MNPDEFTDYNNKSKQVKLLSCKFECLHERGPTRKFFRGYVNPILLIDRQ